MKIRLWGDNSNVLAYLEVWETFVFAIVIDEDEENQDD